MVLPSERAPIAGLIADRFGGPTHARYRAVALGTALETVLPNDPGRFGWLIVNRGSAEVSLWFDRSIAAGQGIPLAPNAWWSAYWEEDGELVAYELVGISAAAAQTLYVVEYKRT